MMQKIFLNNLNLGKGWKTMAATIVTAVDQALALAPADMPQDLINAWSYTTTFAQAHARTVNSDPSTQAYFDAMTQELMKLGWNVTEANKLDYEQQATSITPAAIVKSILNPFLTPPQQAAMAGLLDVIQQPNAGVTNFITFWHNKASTSAHQHNMAMGTLTEKLNSADLEMVYYSFDFDASAERWLFVEVDSASLGVNAYHLEMNLNLPLYNAVKDELIKRLTGKVDEHIQETTLDL